MEENNPFSEPDPIVRRVIRAPEVANDIFTPVDENKVLITLHRRENFGGPMEKIFSEIDLLAKEYPHLEFIFPMHPNPNVQKLRPILKNVNITVGVKSISKMCFPRCMGSIEKSDSYGAGEMFFHN